MFKEQGALDGRRGAGAGVKGVRVQSEDLLRTISLSHGCSRGVPGWHSEPGPWILVHVGAGEGGEGAELMVEANRSVGGLSAGSA